MGKRKAVKRTAVSVPESIEEVAKLISAIGKHQRAITQIQAKVNEQIEKIKAEALTKTQPHEREIEDLRDRIYIFAMAFKNELTEGGKKKTVRLPTGIFFWRTNPPSVSIRGAEEVVELCEKLGLARFIRTTRVPDKTAMLKEQKVADEIKGVTIVHREEFGIKPSETELEIFQDTKKLKKVLK